MAATVKPLEAKAVHLIQSGQVIVDLCSVVKELVENSLDAGANAIEVRFKNNGLDEIEVQDNGSGIAASNYENLALKHYTSKLVSYDDLENLSTFGFRGEALSSLCALSTFVVTTAQADEAPKGHRLTFESSGKLKSTALVACQRGTTVTVGNLFENLPVRQKELAKNIKREYAKVLGVLHAYACISTGVKLTVKNSMPKGKSIVVFATKSNLTTRENIANVYGAKMLSALASLELELNFESTSDLAQARQRSTAVIVEGHISRPVFGEGRQTPDRQMFFVNGRPCGLPQIAKAMNEVYKPYNVSQSPFIFANFRMDTKAYDVNVSPDKRSIFLHDAAILIESLKAELTTMFDEQDQTVPQTQLRREKLPDFKHVPVHRSESHDSAEPSSPRLSEEPENDQNDNASTPETSDGTNRLLHNYFDGFASKRQVIPGRTGNPAGKDAVTLQSRQNPKSAQALGRALQSYRSEEDNENQSDQEDDNDSAIDSQITAARPHRSQNDHVAATWTDSRREPSFDQESVYPNFSDSPADQDETAIASVHQLPRQSDHGIVQTAFDRVRPGRGQAELATITIGDKTITKVIGSPSERQRTGDRSVNEPRQRQQNTSIDPRSLLNRLGQFAAPGTQERSELETIEIADVDEASLVGSDVDDGHSDREATSVELNGRAEQARTTSDGPQTPAGGSQSDPDYINEDEEKVKEKKRVAELIRAAEELKYQSQHVESTRATKALRGGRSKDATTGLQIVIDGSIEATRQQCLDSTQDTLSMGADRTASAETSLMMRSNPEEALSLTVSKVDFANMHIVGQFNLGFILAVRRQKSEIETPRKLPDELFIIDQHASDEKYNFERLQAETVVGNQRMVRPVTLDLTAVEEEIIIDATAVLEKNGFIVDVDLSGDKPVGQRCQLVSLPLSKEVVFNTRDLDELVHLLSETPMLSDLKSAPRPSKVRKMFAMRACRSSIMIGRTLSKKQMETVVQHMGTIDKPWNCPHGRPTMRHLATLDSLDASLWQEGDGVQSGGDVTPAGEPTRSERIQTGRVWQQYVG